MYRLVVCAVVLVSSSAAAAASWPAKPIEIRLEHPRGAHHRTVPVEIAGGTHSMLFDTGGGVTAISPALAKQLNCQITGTSIGLRMTGERVETPLCRDVELRVGGLVIRTEAAVIDLAGMLGKNGPQVDGMVSLATLDGFAVSLDLSHDKVTIESARSLVTRTKKATKVPFRRATGLSGGQLSPFAGVATKGGTVWLEIDSGHGGSATFVSPQAATLLGDAGHGEVNLELGARLDAHTPVVVRKDLVLDGVLSAAMVARSTWTFDLRSDALWVGAIAPIVSLPATTASNVTPPDRDPTGVYELSLVVGGTAAPHVVRVRREDRGLVAEMRALGADETVRIDDVKLEGSTLVVVLPLRTPAPMRITFDGLDGTGTWGDASRGGKVTAKKRS
jgi:hypothetical protein